VRIGTLGTIAAAARGLRSPAVTVVGDVVRHAADLHALVEEVTTT
jgi:siroheme synthase